MSSTPPEGQVSVAIEDATSFSGASSEAALQVPPLGERTPPAIPDHELLRLIGRGSYGEVWLARGALGSLRAVKIVYRNSFDHERPYEREFEGLKKFEPLSHARESQVDIFHVDRNDAAGFFYYIMELADDATQPNRSSRGDETQISLPAKTNQSLVTSTATYQPRTLKHDLRTRGALPVSECIEIALSLTRALEHLHSHGLVHRDIKTSNIIFVNGQPKLADIGLVTSVDATRSFVGTDGYIPPEGPGTPQADLYSLGKVLYELVTGKDRLDFPELPDQWRTRSDFDQLLEFNEILTKACDGDPKQRYQSGAAMVRELETLHVGQSVKRRRIRQRTGAYARKVVLSLATLAAMSGIAYWLSGWRTHPSASTQSGQLDFTFSTNGQANEEFRKGQRSLLAGHTSQNSLQAIQHLQRAVELDPNFADAWAQLAGAWNSAAGTTNQQANVLAAAEKAVYLNPNSALANSMLASAKCQALDWAGAEQARLRSIALAPNSEEILLRSALNLASMGRAKEALVCLERALRADPTSASNLRTIYSGYAYAWCGQYDLAIEIFNQFPDASFWMKEQHAQAYLAKEDYPSAIRLQRQAALAVSEDKKEVNEKFDALETAFRERGKEAYWKLRLQFESPETEGDHWMRMAEIYARLNQQGEAMEYLRQAKEKTPGEFSFIFTNPSFSSLRGSPQFQELVAALWRKK